MVLLKEVLHKRCAAKGRNYLHQSVLTERDVQEKMDICVRGKTAAGNFEYKVFIYISIHIR